MEVITKKDINFVTECAGTDVREPERSKLKEIYSKLEHVCRNLPSEKFSYKIRKDPRSQGGGFKYFQNYLWAKIFPLEFKDDIWDKLAIIFGIAGDTLHLHIMGIGKYQNYEASQYTSKKSWKELNLDNLEYNQIIKEIDFFYNENRDLFIQTAHDLGLKNFKSILNNLKMEKHINLLQYKKQIILQGPPGTGKTREAKYISKELLNLSDIKELDENEQFKILQFHPSYTYEDFVRGIVAESKGEKIEYKNVNKALGLFAEKALKNFYASSNSSLNDFEIWIDEKFEDFKNQIEIEIEEKELILSGDITLFKTESDNFRYGKQWATPARINFIDFKKLIKAKLEDKLEISNQQISKEISVHAHYRYTYYNALLKIFFDKYHYQTRAVNTPLKNYVLIIDEINRANLSSVLGELIYALEYRGEAVESMYEVAGENKLILPPNLYIIGTMNTADRSVGHIDYAIRRRFAFVDVLPKDLSSEEGILFDSSLFHQVSELFETNLSTEFDKKDVQLGHSYFIQKKQEDDNGNDVLVPSDFNIRLEYEIKPILLEYVKDGVLIGDNIKQKIEELETSI